MFTRLGLLAFAIVASGVLGAAFGAALNLLNAQVSPEFFQIVLGAGTGAMSLGDEALLHGLADGGLAGAGFGALLIVFCAATGWRYLHLRSMLVAMVGGLAAAAVCVGLFGTCGLLLGWLDPVAYYGIVPMARRATNLPAFGWVGGSIWGGYAAPLPAFLTAAVVWVRQLLKTVATQPAFELADPAHDSKSIGQSRLNH